MSNKLTKKIPKFLIDMESEKRSKVFYPDYTSISYDKDDSPSSAEPAKNATGDETKASLSKNDLEAKKLKSGWLSKKNPFLTQQEIFELTGIKSGSRQAKIKKDLILNECIIEHKLQVGKTKTSIWEPTKKAYELLSFPMPAWQSKGGYLHQYCAFHIHEIGKDNGFQTQIEYFLDNGKAVDVLLKNDKVTIFVEIVTSKPLEKEISNIIKDFSSSLIPDRLIMAVQDGQMKKELEKMIKTDTRIKEYRKKIHVVLSGNLIKERKIPV